MKLHSLIIFINLIFLFTAISCKRQTQQNKASENIDSVASFSASNKSEVSVSSLPTIEFTEEKHDFGDIIAGEKVSYAFSFKNTGSVNLLINSAQGSCGCTVPSFPKDPIKPGEKGLIDVVFNSEGKSGMVEKTITLVTNCKPSTKILTIVAKITSTEK
ncbi:MAG: DUF1573 domain-containing protein [Bacteroidia bacterium]